MMINLVAFISDRFKKFFKTGDSGKPEDSDDSGFIGREKAIAFSIAFLFALCLWFIVNLSRDFTVTVQVPIQLVNIPDDVALSSDVPEYASVNISGEGWKLIPLYSNPPKISLTAESRQINLIEQMRNQVGAFSDLNVLQVEPIVLNIETEEKTTKRVPVVSRVDLGFRSQYGLVQTPAMEPDSVTVTGGRSKLAEIEYWETEEAEISNINRSMERRVELASPARGMAVEPSSVLYRIEVSEYTESEVRVPIRTRNLPSGQAITYNPSAVTVRFDVPIGRYSEVQGMRPFTAYVDYEVIENDTTGFVTPVIELVNDDLNLRLRNFQPGRVSYFNIIPD
jgi:YbbR domain-containing protein